MKKKVLILLLAVLSIIGTGCSGVSLNLGRSVMITNATHSGTIDVYINGNKVLSRMKPGEVELVSYYSFGTSYLNVLARHSDSERFIGIAEKNLYIYNYSSYGNSWNNYSVIFYKRDFRK